MRKNIKKIISVLLVILLHSCTTEKSERKYFVVEIPSKYEGYIHVVFNSDAANSKSLFQKGAYVSVSPDTSGIIFVKDKYEEWMSKLQLTFIDNSTKQSLTSSYIRTDSIQVFNPKMIDIGKQKRYKCFEVFISRDLLPAKDSVELNFIKKSKQYQIQMLLSQ